MACFQNLVGITKDCNSSKGGIVEAYIRNHVPNGYDVVRDTIASVSDTGWKCFSFKKGTGSMTSTLNVDIPNGINYVETELVLQFNRMEVAKRLEIVALSKGELDIIVKDSNGKYYGLGYDNAVTVGASTGQTGTQFSDGNNYTISFTDQSKTFPYLLRDSLGKHIEDVAKNGTLKPVIGFGEKVNPDFAVGSTQTIETVTNIDLKDTYSVVSSNPDVAEVVSFKNGVAEIKGLKSGIVTLSIVNSKGIIIDRIKVAVK